MCMSQPTAQTWEQLYRDEFPRLYRALLMVLRDRDLVLDALHDAFAEGLERPPGHSDNLMGWLFRVALRRGRRSYRRRMLSALRSVVLPAARDDIASALDRAEVNRLLGMLSARQRAIVVAEYYLDLDQDEIAQLFGVQRGTIAATLAQARARMRAGGGQDV